MVIGIKNGKGSPQGRAIKNCKSSPQSLHRVKKIEVVEQYNFGSYSSTEVERNGEARIGIDKEFKERLSIKSSNKIAIP